MPTFFPPFVAFVQSQRSHALEPSDLGRSIAEDHAWELWVAELYNAPRPPLREQYDPQ